ncbi:uncharacterized protein LOC121424179 [Lytechinus variegatus]|uniref:uncharacterized protein LOC121424179 n=1 Tax=Lytechinus variegatus TaxID=7654 RepID=UPI001BB27763|nr:uncharacterized protein LOC121424179 [Lytechinus variegatus]
MLLPNSTSKELQLLEEDACRDDDTEGSFCVNFDQSSVTSIHSATSIHSVTTIESMVLRQSWSAPAILSRDSRQTLMPEISPRAEDEPPSTSYPRDVRVSAQDFLSYHRFINDKDNDDVSVLSDVDYSDEHYEADVESNIDDDKASISGFEFSGNMYTVNVHKEFENLDDEETDDGSSGNMTSSESVMVKRCVPDQITNIMDANWSDEDTIYPSSTSEGNDVTNNDDKNVDEEKDVGVPGEIGDRILLDKYHDFQFNIVDDIWNACGNIYQTGLQIVQDIVMGEHKNEMDIGEGRTLVDDEETGDHTSSGHPGLWDVINCMITGVPLEKREK